MAKKQEIGVINYALYRGSTEFTGITQADLPSLEFLTMTINGAGIAGELEVPLIGQMKAMEISLKHTVLTKQGIQLSAPKMQTWELREVQESKTNAGELKPTGVKHVLKVLPKKMDGGSLKPQSSSDPTTVASVWYWAEYRDNTKVMELDPENYVCYIDGVDYLAAVRKAMGK